MKRFLIVLFMLGCGCFMTRRQKSSPVSRGTFYSAPAVFNEKTKKIRQEVIDMLDREEKISKKKF